ncbi:MAG TPA: DEAD/DEAH box helicase [Tepidisphaeraceae bacterium]|jgi:CRISPR-associated endonuclease/helicase Cas3
MSEPLAHSARLERNIPAQTYREHISQVRDYAVGNAENMVKYFKGDGQRIVAMVRRASEFHDLGKLDPNNQAVLAGGNSRKPLEVKHEDAGVAHLLSPEMRDFLAAYCVHAHHRGLCNWSEASTQKSGHVLRDNFMLGSGRSVRDHVNASLTKYLDVHYSTMGSPPHDEIPKGTIGRSPLMIRLALSCLVDADHHDTAKNYGEPAAYDGPSLCAGQRLLLLDAHIRCLEQSQSGNRRELRSAIYTACRESHNSSTRLACDSPVGTGKTTAVMAHLLNIAEKLGLRRIFVVLPFTNIIDQSVEVYRHLAFFNERPEDVVAAHHHRAEFDDPSCRQFSFLWHAPIVVTTAVQFFETLASNRPTALRKLHQLPGAAIFLDEAHAALPVDLWPQAWKWLRELCNTWGCHVVLASGSLARFWTLEEFSQPTEEVDNLVSPNLTMEAKKAENYRVTYKQKTEPLDLTQLIKWVVSIPGPRLLIVNTVQSAAVIAEELRQKYGAESIEHLSTALCPSDRQKTLDRVRRRLRDASDADWTLVATSCVEAGVDISFRNGFRESCSLNSLIQTSGRVNREGKWKDSAVWDFRLQYSDVLRQHPAFKESADVLAGLFVEQSVRPDFCTEAMRREIRRATLAERTGLIERAEKAANFPEVANLFEVIESDTETVVVDLYLAKKLEGSERVTSQDIQLGSVQIWKKTLPLGAAIPVDRFPGVLIWKLGYDAFIGYMRGILDNRAFLAGQKVF